jgi:hypothetical protein
MTITTSACIIPLRIRRHLKKLCSGRSKTQRPRDEVVEQVEQVENIAGEEWSSPWPNTLRRRNAVRYLDEPICRGWKLVRQPCPAGEAWT